MDKPRLARLAVIVLACGLFRAALAENPKRDVVDPRSLADDRVHHDPGTASLVGAGAEPTVRMGGLSESPIPAVFGRTVNIAFAVPARASGVPPTDLRVEVYDIGGRRIDLVPPAHTKVEHGLITVTWNRKKEVGRRASPRVYVVRAVAPSIGFRSERRLVVR